jgi:hypothetical protein
VETLHNIDLSVEDAVRGRTLGYSISSRNEQADSKAFGSVASFVENWPRHVLHRLVVVQRHARAACYFFNSVGARSQFEHYSRAKNLSFRKSARLPFDAIGRMNPSRHLAALIR